MKDAITVLEINEERSRSRLTGPCWLQKFEIFSTYRNLPGVVTALPDAAVYRPICGAPFVGFSPQWGASLRGPFPARGAFASILPGSLLLPVSCPLHARAVVISRVGRTFLSDRTL
jgi:hypothetical protein